MYKILLCVILGGIVTETLCENHEDAPAVAESSRKKRLLFYDEEGNLVKTYTNPLRGFAPMADKNPVIGFFNPFWSFLRPPSSFGSSSFGSPTPYMIPVSDEVVQQINDPMMQNKLIFLPARDMNPWLNPLCNKLRGQLPSPSSCNRFLNCWEGRAYEQDCPEGLMFSDKGYCDFPYNVDCNNRATPPSKDEMIPSPCRLSERVRNPDNCNEFFSCIGGYYVKFKCLPNLAYDEERNVCDSSEKVQCSVKIQAPSGELNTNATDSQNLEASASGSSNNKMIRTADLDWILSQRELYRGKESSQMDLQRLANIST